MVRLGGLCSAKVVNLVMSRLRVDVSRLDVDERQPIWGLRALFEGSSDEDMATIIQYCCDDEETISRMISWSRGGPKFNIFQILRLLVEIYYCVHEETNNNWLLCGNAALYSGPNHHAMITHFHIHNTKPWHPPP